MSDKYSWYVKLHISDTKILQKQLRLPVLLPSSAYRRWKEKGYQEKKLVSEKKIYLDKYFEIKILKYI